MTKPGGVCDRPVDFMTIYPTLCQLTGLAIPKHVEGPSLVKLLADPKAAWDRPALTTFHKDNHSFRSESWRLIRYADGSEELYNHDIDPYEWTNLAGEAKHAAVKADLLKSVPKQNAAELPRDAAGAEGKAKAKAGKQR